MKTKRTFIPVFNTQRSIITYRMQRKRGCRHKENADNTDGIRHRSCYGICCGIRNRNGRGFRHKAGRFISAGKPDFCRSCGCME